MVLGATHGRLGDVQAAIHCSEQAVSIMPASIQALDNLALGYHQAGRIEEACSVLERRLALDPHHRDTVLRLAQGLRSTGQTERAIDVYRQYLRMHPEDTELHMKLGIACEFTGELSHAEAHYRRTLELQPGSSGAMQNLANVLSAQGRTAEAIAAYRGALELDPGNAIARSNYLLNLHYEPDCSVQDIYREHVERMHHAGAADHGRTFGNETDPQRPLRIGFVSPDMRTHSVAYFFEALLESMDAGEFASYCYADVPLPDATTARLRRLSTHWRDIAGADTGAVCNRIRSDRIDILVDLAGHTSSRNLAVFASRPAPVQVTWLGYPDTTGLRNMDYRVTDRIADPVGDSTPGTERLLRLDGCLLCYRPPADAPAVAALPAVLNGYITFGSFNNLAKVNDRVLALWAGLLGQVADARLYLKNPSFTDEATRTACREKLAGLGIAPDRISLAGRTRTTAEHLQLYSGIDIGLDTFPYNGTTTTCEALWMGVPVVTKTGAAHAGRVGASLLNAVGHAGWCATDDADYLRIAAGLAGDMDALARIRSRLRDDMRQSMLCDPPDFARRFTRALRDVWVKHCADDAG